MKAAIGLGIVGGAVYFLTRRKTASAASAPGAAKAKQNVAIRPTVIRPAQQVSRFQLKGVGDLGQEMPTVDILPEQIEFDWNPTPTEQGGAVEPYLDPGSNIDWYGSTTSQQPAYIPPAAIYPSAIRPTVVWPSSGIPTQYPVGVQSGYYGSYYPTQQSSATAAYDSLITQGLSMGLISIAPRQPARARCVATNVLAASPYCAVVFLDRTGKKKMAYRQAVAYVQRQSAWLTVY